MSNKTLGWLLLFGGAALYGLSLMDSQPGSGITHIPANGQYGPWKNNTGVGVYIDAAKNIYSQAGVLLGNLTTIFENTNANTLPGDSDPAGDNDNPSVFGIGMIPQGGLM